jgi:hypothetical protein
MSSIAQNPLSSILPSGQQLPCCSETSLDLPEDSSSSRHNSKGVLRARRAKWSGPSRDSRAAHGRRTVASGRRGSLTISYARPTLHQPPSTCQPFTRPLASSRRGVSARRTPVIDDGSSVRMPREPADAPAGRDREMHGGDEAQIQTRATRDRSCEYSQATVDIKVEQIAWHSFAGRHLTAPALFRFLDEEQIFL